MLLLVFFSLNFCLGATLSACPVSSICFLAAERSLAKEGVWPSSNGSGDRRGGLSEYGLGIAPSEDDVSIVLTWAGSTFGFGNRLGEVTSVGAGASAGVGGIAGAARTPAICGKVISTSGSNRVVPS